MDRQAPSTSVKRLEAEVRRVLRPVDIRQLASRQRIVLEELEQNLADSKTYSQGWELSETRPEQTENARQARKWLASAQKNILAASQFNIFSAIDVAHLSAQIEQLKKQLR
ncbi:MAG TPA: hypothetical protein VFP35_01755 [Candidatus Saccharimonadales bacterium]|nr:hypothetical protein [Candidatus Saccharimonadales bacterium]